MGRNSLLLIHETIGGNLRKMDLKRVSEKYNYEFPDFYKRLWEDGMLDWYKGWNEPWTKERNWVTEIYPKIKDEPPILMHSGGFDFQMLSPNEILEYEFCEWWDTKHKFIPFARTNAGDLYAFYKNIEIEKNNPIVLVWHDDNRTEILAKNFEDFIFRKMIERVVHIDEDDINENFEGDNNIFKNKLLSDLGTAKKYLKPRYVSILNEIYNRSFSELDSIISVSEMKDIFKETIKFEKIDTEFEHEIDE